MTHTSMKARSIKSPCLVMGQTGECEQAAAPLACIAPLIRRLRTCLDRTLTAKATMLHSILFVGCEATDHSDPTTTPRRRRYKERPRDAFIGVNQVPLAPRWDS